MSKQTAAVAVKGGSGVDSSSPPANVIKLWKEVEDKLLLQKGKACLEIKHIPHYYVCRHIMMHLLTSLLVPPLVLIPTRTTFSNSIINKI